MRQFVPDSRIHGAPPLPKGRPPTRAEVWERNHYIYYDLKGHTKTPICRPECKHQFPGELEGFCKEAWVYYYVDAFNHRDWRCQPNWKEGDPVIPEAVPDVVFKGGDVSGWNRTVYACLETAAQLTRRAA